MNEDKIKEAIRSKNLIKLLRQDSEYILINNVLGITDYGVIVFHIKKYIGFNPFRKRRVWVVLQRSIKSLEKEARFDDALSLTYAFFLRRKSLKYRCNEFIRLIKPFSNYKRNEDDVRVADIHACRPPVE